MSSGPTSQLVPLAAQIACVRREISMRERVYPRWVAERKLTLKTADNELAAMHAVLATLERVQASERLL